MVIVDGEDRLADVIRSQRGAFGASGAGELPLSSPHASIMNAIANATGVRVRELPATPDKVLAALKG